MWTSNLNPKSDIQFLFRFVPITMLDQLELTPSEEQIVVNRVIQYIVCSV